MFKLSYQYMEETFVDRALGAGVGGGRAVLVPPALYASAGEGCKTKMA